MLRRLSILSVFLCTALSGCFCACSEDITDESNAPALYLQVKNLAELLGTNPGTACSTYHNAIKKYEDNYSMEGACLEYNETRANRSLENVAYNLTNSGFYMTAFILIDRWNDAIANCAAGNNSDISSNKVTKEYQELFDVNGCENILSDADSITKTQSSIRL